MSTCVYYVKPSELSWEAAELLGRLVRSGDIVVCGMCVNNVGLIKIEQVGVCAALRFVPIGASYNSISQQTKESSCKASKKSTQLTIFTPVQTPAPTT